MALKPFDRVEIEWLDSGSWSGWRRMEDVIREVNEDNLIHYSTGYLLFDSDKGVCIVQSHTDEKGMVADVLIVPQVAVVKTRLLRRG